MTRGRHRASLSAVGADNRRAAVAERRTWWRAFALVLLATLAWSSGIPLLTGPDEPSQVVRAAGVVRGDAIGRPVPGTDNFFVEVSAPAGYEIAAEAGGCFLGEAHIDGARGVGAHVRAPHARTSGGSTRASSRTPTTSSGARRPHEVPI